MCKCCVSFWMIYKCLQVCNGNCIKCLLGNNNGVLMYILLIIIKKKFPRTKMRILTWLLIIYCFGRFFFFFGRVGCFFSTTEFDCQDVLKILLKKTLRTKYYQFLNSIMFFCFFLNISNCYIFSFLYFTVELSNLCSCCILMFSSVIFWFSQLGKCYDSLSKSSLRIFSKYKMLWKI